MALRNELRTQGDFLFKYRSYLPIVIIIPGIIVYVLNELQTGGIDTWQSQAYELGCVLISLLGLLIRVVAIGYSSDNTSGRNTVEGQIAEDVNTTGLYATCRHPLYVGNFLMWLGIAAFTQNFWFIAAFIFLFWLYYERIMYAEEEFLIGKYGDQYLNWAQNTPAFFPRLGRWKKPKNDFSWVKVIRQEKAGILYLFLIFLLLKVIGEYAVNQELMVEPAFWIAFGAALVWYIVIKILQKTTGLLDTDR